MILAKVLMDDVGARFFRDIEPLSTSTVEVSFDEAKDDE
jgi:hypothetical protein